MGSGSEKPGRGQQEALGRTQGSKAIGQREGRGRARRAWQGGGGFGNYWRWVGPRRHFVERRGSTGLAAALTIFCFLCRRLSYCLSHRRRHHSRLLSRRRTVTSSHATACPDGGVALPSLVHPLAPPQDIRSLRAHIGQVRISHGRIGCHASLRGQVRLKEQNPARDLEAIGQ